MITTTMKCGRFITTGQRSSQSLCLIKGKYEDLHPTVYKALTGLNAAHWGNANKQKIDGLESKGTWEVVDTRLVHSKLVLSKFFQIHRPNTRHGWLPVIHFEGKWRFRGYIRPGSTLHCPAGRIDNSILQAIVHPFDWCEPGVVEWHAYTYYPHETSERVWDKWQSVQVHWRSLWSTSTWSPAESTIRWICKADWI